MSIPLCECANCGANIPRLNLRCEYCNHWNVDPANPQDPPVAAPPAPPPVPPPAAAAPPPVPPPVPAPAVAPPPVPSPAVAPPPVPTAVVAPPVPPPVPATGAVVPPPIPAGADAAKRPLFGSKPAVAERPAPSKPKPLPSRAPVEPAAKSRVIQSVVARPEAASGWESGRRVFNSKAPPASSAEQGSLARIQAVMAVAYWVATSDDGDEMDDDEYDAIVATFSELLGEDVDEAALERSIAAWDEAIEADEEAFLAEAVEAIGTGPMRRQALEIATVVSAADDDLSDTEEEALGELAAALGYADRESERIIEGALESLEE